MSSILDALRKLEAEKADTPAQDDLVMDNVAAERDLVGEGLMRTGTTLRITPGILIACIVGLSVLVGIGATAGVAIWWTRSAVEPGPIASVGAPANAQPSIVIPPVSTVPVVPAPSVASTVPSFPPPAPPVSVQPPQPVPVPVPAPPVSVQPQQPAQPVPAASQPQPAAAVLAPAPLTPQSPVVVTPPPRASTDVPATDIEPVSSKPPRSGKGTRIVAGRDEIHVAAASSTEFEKPVREQEVRMEAPRVSEVKDSAKSTSHKDDNIDVYSLPVLKESDKARFGLSDLRVNMVRPAGKNAPYGSAVINLRPVYVGERIPNTSATLVAVEARGIAIEAGDSGERFYIRF